MPIEFLQESQPTGSSDNSLFRLLMKYDGSGRRISKTRWVKKVGSQDWEKELVTHYTGIGTEIRENYAGPAKQTKVVVNMPQGLGRYGIEDAENPDMGSGVGYIPNTKFEWYLKNHLGSTMLVYGTQADANPSHSDIGTPLAAYDYRAFGEMIELTPSPTGKVTENFTGKEHDDEIALNYFGARYLDPMLGMWISVDPARQYQNPYLYAGNNPIALFDLDGNEDIYFLLGGTLQNGRALISMTQFKSATSGAAQNFQKYGYSVKYAYMTKSSFNQAVKDPNTKKIFTISHVYNGNGTLRSYKKIEGYIGSKDIQINKNVDLISAGCRSKGHVEKQWEKNFNEVTGLESNQILSTDALDELNTSADGHALDLFSKKPDIDNHLNDIDNE